MESDAKYTLIGGFVVGSLLVATLLIVWLSNNGVKADSKLYTIYFKNQSLNGLQLNSAVTMKGIKVGIVDKLGISTKNMELVQIIVKLAKETPIKVDTKATINRNLLTGLAVIELMGGRQESAELAQIHAGEDHPVIPEGSSGLDAVASSIPELMQEATEVFGQFKGVLSTENLDRLGRTIENVEKISEVLARNSQKIDGLIVNSNKLVTDLQTTSANLARYTKPMDGELSKFSQALIDGVAELKGMIKNFSSKTSDVATELSNSFRIMAQDVNTAATGVAQAARSFSSTAEHLSDLRSIVSAPDERTLGPGEKKKGDR